MAALPVAACLLAASPRAHAAEAATSSACARLDPARSVRLDGADLHEQSGYPDAADARVAAQFARGSCRVAADAALASRLATAPDEAATLTLDARRDLLDGDRAVAERKLRAALARAPGFAPAKALLAEALLGSEQRVEASALLADASASAPPDLRAAVLRLRLDALEQPHGAGPAKLVRLVRDEAMPPDLREMAQATVLYATALDVAQKEQVLREALRFDAPTPLWQRQLALGRFLAEDAHKAAPAREVLQAVLDGNAPAGGQAEARVLLAETWLHEAAAIAPQPGPENAAQVARARAAAGRDLPALATRVRGLHDLASLVPFVADIHDPDARDAQHLTALCRATQALDAARVQAALDAGAAVDGECAGATALAFVVRAGPGDFARKRAVASLLLARGAAPDPPLYPGSSYTARSFCADHFPECERELLPLLDAALRQRGPQAVAPVPVPAR
jgi:hypothetical protein